MLPQTREAMERLIEGLIRVTGREGSLLIFAETSRRMGEGGTFAQWRETMIEVAREHGHEPDEWLPVEQQFPDTPEGPIH